MSDEQSRWKAIVVVIVAVTTVVALVASVVVTVVVALSAGLALVVLERVMGPNRGRRGQREVSDVDALPARRTGKTDVTPLRNAALILVGLGVLFLVTGDPRTGIEAICAGIAGLILAQWLRWRRG